MRPRKAPASPPNLDLYALAEARFDELEKLPACGKCKDCPGPEAPGSRCFDWQPGTPALKRRDWDFCPVGHTRVVTWRRLVDRFVTTKATPVSDFPEGYVAGVVSGVTRLHVALRKEEERRLEERRGAPRSGSGAPFRAKMQGGPKR